MTKRRLTNPTYAPSSNRGGFISSDMLQYIHDGLNDLLNPHSDAPMNASAVIKTFSAERLSKVSYKSSDGSKR